MKHLIKIVILLFAVTLITGKPMPDEWDLVRDNDIGAWTDEGDLSSDARVYINSESNPICCRLEIKICCYRK